MARALPAARTPAAQAMSRLGHGRSLQENLASDVLARTRIGPGGTLTPLLSEPVEVVDEDRPPAPVAPPAAPAAPAIARMDSTGLSGLALARARLVHAVVATPAVLRWVRNLTLGALLSFADASLATLSPVGFLWKHARDVGLGLVYLLVPLASSLALLYHVPALGQAVVPSTLGLVIFMVGLYVSCAFLWLLCAFCAAAAWRGAGRLARHFAHKGQVAFS